MSMDAFSKIVQINDIINFGIKAWGSFGHLVNKNYYKCSLKFYFCEICFKNLKSMTLDQGAGLYWWCRENMSFCNKISTTKIDWQMFSNWAELYSVCGWQIQIKYDFACLSIYFL